MPESVAFWLTIVLFSLTYLGLALGRCPACGPTGPASPWPGRPRCSPSGPSLRRGVRAVDFATIVLLLGMMVVVAFLGRAGLFDAAGPPGRVGPQPPAMLAVTMPCPACCPPCW